jgi:hypothetical protein
MEIRNNVRDENKDNTYDQMRTNVDRVDTKFLATDERVPALGGRPLDITFVKKNIAMVS